MFPLNDRLKQRVLSRPWKGYDRFVKACADWITAVSKEAELREQQQVLDLASYTKLRRENSAVRPCLVLIEYATGKALPDGIWNEDTFNLLNTMGIDMVALSNVRF